MFSVQVAPMGGGSVQVFVLWLALLCRQRAFVCSCLFAYCVSLQGVRRGLMVGPSVGGLLDG